MRKCKLFICGCVGWLFVIAGYAQTVRYVSPDGTNDITGGYTNWEGAATTIQAAITASINGDIILVSTGVYTAAGAQVVNINKALDIRGVDGRDQTIIDGQNARRGVYFKITSGGSVTFSGFTIQNCWTNRGAGIYMEGTRNVIVENCRIMNNVAYSTERAGGGVFKYIESGTLTLTNCAIVSNIASVGYGGGLYSHYGHLYLHNSTVLSNWAGYGGGLAAGGTGSAQAFEVRNSLIAYNHTTGGGGGVYSECDPTAVPSVLYDSTIAHNTAESYGGGFHQRNVSSYPGHISMTNCEIRENIALNYGGGLSLSGKTRLSNCLIAENTASNTVGGGILISLNATNEIRLENITIVSNAAIGQPTCYAGGLMVYGGVTNVTVINSIIYHNTQQGAYAGRTNIYISAGSAIVFTNCCTAPLTSVVGTGNTNADPLFVELSVNYRLQESSPCINAGLNEAWMSGAVDLDGRPRIDRFSGKVDMGCYEYIPEGMLFMTK